MVFLDVIFFPKSFHPTSFPVGVILLPALLYVHVRLFEHSCMQRACMRACLHVHFVFTCAIHSCVQTLLANPVSPTPCTGQWQQSSVSIEHPTEASPAPWCVPTLIPVFQILDPFKLGMLEQLKR